MRAAVSTGERCIRTEPVDAPVKVAEDIARGTEASVHEIIDGVRFRISARSFWQSRADGVHVLVDLVRAAVGPERTVADLYCGVGLFSGLLDAPRQVFAVEKDRHAFADARDNLKSMRGARRALRRGEVAARARRRRDRRSQPGRSRASRRGV